jgi:rare lipoprotein A
MRWNNSAALLLVLVLAACSTPPPPKPAPPPTTRIPPPPMDTIPDAVPKTEPRSRKGNPPFYEVYGTRYHVMTTSDGYHERGVASWYGKQFHGGDTSNGERYDMYAMSAAHKTLPLPCYVQVTNLKNGKSVVVRVNDRGPFVANRIIDLSYSAAAKLDMIREGTTLVDVRALHGVDGAPVTAGTDELFVQAGAFTEEANAQRLLARLRAAGIGVAFIRRDDHDGRPLYRVRVGPVPSVAEFDRVVADLRGVGVHDARLATE